MAWHAFCNLLWLLLSLDTLITSGMGDTEELGGFEILHSISSGMVSD